MNERTNYKRYYFLLDEPLNFSTTNAARRANDGD